MEMTKVLKEQLRNTNINLNNIYEEQRNLITKYIKEKKKLFVTELPKDEDGNYTLPDFIGSVEELDYFPIESEITNSYGDDSTQWIKVLGFEYNKKYDEINVFYCDNDSDTEILCGTFDYIFETSYRNIVNMIVRYND